MSVITLSHELIHKGNLILVNPDYAFESEPDELLIPALDSAPEILLQRCAATLLNRLMQEIHGWGSIVPVSGWRSLQEQQQIWDDTLQESGPEYTRKYVAVPGHSEHQTGLAIDLGLKQEHVDFICPDFPDTGICKLFREKAAKYGFILRYPAGKEEITGIGHEPWHFRYVGIPHAQIMTENGLTLEEYMTFIRQFPFGGKPYLIRNGRQEITISFIKYSEEAAADKTSSTLPHRQPDRISVESNPLASLAIEISDRHPYTVSGNNVDGFILTEWK